MNKINFYIAGFIFILFSCGTTKNITGGKIQQLSIDELDTKIKENTFQFNTLTAKAKIDVSSESMNQSVNANIEMEKDKFIGISLRVLGIEGAKIYITPDSVKILDRINQKYYPRDFSYIEKLFSIKADFQTLQKLLLGDVIYFEGTKYPLVPDSCTCYEMVVQNGALKNTIKIFPSFDVMQMFVEDMQNKRTMMLTYDDYQNLKGQNFSFLRTIRIDAVEMYAVDMEFTSVTLNEPLNFTFPVNSKYEKVTD
ncbi:MAG: DUF4292 domain-containing protein [Fimbriimonadaceae bacterium]|nr:DUF4292 domain-containing protein [Chitinophagales bacterium]